MHNLVVVVALLLHLLPLKILFQILGQSNVHLHGLVGMNKQKEFLSGLQSKWANKLCHKDRKVQTHLAYKVTAFTI